MKRLLLLAGLILVGGTFVFLNLKSNKSVVINEQTDPKETISQTLDWKYFKDENLGIGFSYPINIDSICYEKTGSSLMVEKETKFFKSRMRICKNLSQIFSITIEESSQDTIQNWVKNKTLLKGNATDETFKGFPAIYYEVTDIQQVPSDFHIFKYKGNVITIEVMRTKNGESEQQTVAKIVESLRFD